MLTRDWGLPLTIEDPAGIRSMSACIPSIGPVALMAIVRFQSLGGPRHDDKAIPEGHRAVNAPSTA